METSFRTANGAADCCPACGGEVVVEFLDPSGDNPCPHCRRVLWFLRRSRDGVVTLTFLPGLMSGSEAMERVHEVQEAAASSSRLILNLSPMRLISSMFLGMLVVLYRRTVAANGKVRVCGITREIRDVFEVTKLDKVFDIDEDEQSSLDSF